MADHDRSLQAAREWAARRTFHASGSALETLAELRVSNPTSIAVVIPAKSCASTIGEVAGACVALREAGAVDEVVVIDAASADGTAAIAEAVGASVRQESELLPQFGQAAGKGDAMWRAQAAVGSDVIVYVDGDSAGFDAGFVAGLAAPLLLDRSVQHVKGAYRRPFASGEIRLADGGGRVSELAARPLLNLHFPELAAVQQPLAGEFAARSAALAEMPFLTGYGAEIQLLVDFYRRYGLDAIAQADIGERVNPHQPLHELGAMAFAVARALLLRVDPERHPLQRHPHFVNYVAGEPALREVPLIERPPYASVMEGSHDGA